MEQIVDRSYEKDIINQKYDFIEEIIDEVLVNKAQKAASTERIDKYLTGKWLGLPIFLLIMAFVFFLTFTVGDWLKGYFEIALEVFSNLVSNGLATVHISPMLTSLIVDGIISGVGGILTFLPNIFILFLALALLEDSGYMSRVAFVMDDIMSSLGLSGRAFLPLLLGFGCTVPAVMASRALENKRDRFKTILITPFMSCSARLPIYVLFSSMFFGKYAMIVCYSMYLLGIIIAITTAFILSKIDGSKATHALLIELPEYKTPSAHTIAIYVWQKIKDYLTKAGTVIFDRSILMWATLNFGPHGYVTDISESFGSVIGRLIRTGLSTGRTRILADYCSFDRWYCRKRSCCLQLQRTLRNSKYYDCPRNDRNGGFSWCHWFWPGKCLCTYDILSVICTMHSNHCNDSS